jgi:hypothetical protein
MIKVMLNRAGVIKVCLAAVCYLSACAPGAVAQTRRKPQSTRPVRVGTIKDYPATGLMTGCGNMYFELANRTDTTSVAYVFLARPGGKDAWMNLDGRDVRLDLTKASYRQRTDGSTRWQFAYRAKMARIAVVIEPTSDAAEAHSLAMTITVRHRGATQIIKALGDADC